MRPGRRPCAADIREPNINRPRPSARARASTCLVGTFTRARSRRRGARRANRLVGARRVFFFRFAFAFAFARDSTPDGRRASLMRRRVPSRAPDEPPRDSCCRPRLAVPSRCVYSRAHTLPSFYFASPKTRERRTRTSLPATVLDRTHARAVIRSVQVLRSERPIDPPIEADPRAIGDGGEAPGRALTLLRFRAFVAKRFFVPSPEPNRSPSRARLETRRARPPRGSTRQALRDETSGLGRAV